MRDLFPGYFTPTDDEFAVLWGRCFFVPDTNTLLNLYRYKEQTRQEYLRVFKGLEERMWLPAQVAEEFVRRREDVIRQARRYKSRRELTTAIRKVARADLALRSNAVSKRLVLENLVLDLTAEPKPQEVGWLQEELPV